MALGISSLSLSLEQWAPPALHATHSVQQVLRVTPGNSPEWRTLIFSSASPSLAAKLICASSIPLRTRTQTHTVNISSWPWLCVSWRDLEDGYGNEGLWSRFDLSPVLCTSKSAEQSGKSAEEASSSSSWTLTLCFVGCRLRILLR